MGDKDGAIEVCGKDEYGVYNALEEWLCGTMKCEKLDAGDLSDDTPLPFSDQLYKWSGFSVMHDGSGTNNMGLVTMQLVEFMCNELSWTLGVVNGGNVGKHGEIREQQVIFKAPHPMNLEAGHVMIELRSAGYIEICGSDRKAKDKLHKYFLQEFRATGQTGHQEYSDRYYKSGQNIFKERGSDGENNLGLLTVKVCDAVVKELPGWSLVTMNGGNYGEGGTHREQQLVFRDDEHPLGDNPHVMIELREAGYIEVCGTNRNGIHEEFAQWAAKNWGCKDVPAPSGEPFYDRKLTWKSKDMMVASAEVVEFFHGLGWQMQVCSQGTVSVKGKEESREQQILFRPDPSGYGVTEPHLFIELYCGEGDDNLYFRKNAKGEYPTQVLKNQFIRVREVGECTKAMAELDKFLADYLGAERLDDTSEFHQYMTDVFLCRGINDNNLGCWTMRLCDFMVDRLGWSFVVCNVCNLGPLGCFREQQLVFRYDGERREIPPVKDVSQRLDEIEYIGLKFPPYWETEDVMQLKQTCSTVKCTQEEIASLQSMFDHTFRRILTRDRVYEYQLKVSEEMPFRLKIIHAFRSENAPLWRRYAERRKMYRGGNPMGAQHAKSLDAPLGQHLNSRLADGEAFLCHGTNPSSAMAILKSGFSLNAAGKSTGTMFGYGIYLAECASKSDEYARDDNGGTFPGLLAMLVCRSLVGNPHIVHEAGDYIQQAKDAKCDCLVGDRESKVNTYREFIFFDERQVYPEYTVIYKRVYDQKEVPSHLTHLVAPAKGTTGRNWQLKLEKGWANIPPDVSYALTQAEKDGKTSYSHKIGDPAILYEFDLVKMQQKNTQTGTMREIRRPMRS